MIKTDTYGCTCAYTNTHTHTREYMGRMKESVVLQKMQVVVAEGAVR